MEMSLNEIIDPILSSVPQKERKVSVQSRTQMHAGCLCFSFTVINVLTAHISECPDL